MRIFWPCSSTVHDGQSRRLTAMPYWPISTLGPPVSGACSWSRRRSSPRVMACLSSRRVSLASDLAIRPKTAKTSRACPNCGITRCRLAISRRHEDKRPTRRQEGVTMTRDSDRSSIVFLSTRDWCGIFAIGLTIALALVASYLRHDRMLTEVLTRQAATGERLEDVERSVERLEDRAMSAGQTRTER